MARVDDPSLLADALDRTAGGLRREAGRLGGIVAGLENADFELVALAREIRIVRSGSMDVPTVASVLAAIKRARRFEEAQKRAARGGISRLRLRRQSDRSMTAAVDGRRLDLSPELADLLTILVDEARLSERFIPHTELTARVAEKCGHLLTRRARAQLVFRLKQAFAEVGLNRHFIESQPRRGVRILIRRQRLAQRSQRA